MRSLPLIDRLSLLTNGNSGLTSIAVICVFAYVSLRIFSMADIVSALYLRGELKEAKGIITNSFAAWTMDDENSVAGYEYAFESPIGPLKWVSYQDGGFMYKPNDRVTIEYHPEHPEINRIKGMTNTPGGNAYLAATIPFLLAIIWFLYNVIAGFRQYQLITKGVLSYGKFKKKVKTGDEIENKKVYDMYFSYHDQQGQEHELKSRTHLSRRLEDEAWELMIYDTKKPKRAVMVDLLPWSIPSHIKTHWDLPPKPAS